MCEWRYESLSFLAFLFLFTSFFFLSIYLLIILFSHFRWRASRLSPLLLSAGTWTWQGSLLDSGLKPNIPALLKVISSFLSVFLISKEKKVIIPHPKLYSLLCFSFFLINYRRKIVQYVLNQQHTR